MDLCIDNGSHVSLPVSLTLPLCYKCHIKCQDNPVKHNLTVSCDLVASLCFHSLIRYNFNKLS